MSFGNSTRTYGDGGCGRTTWHLNQNDERRGRPASTRKPADRKPNKCWRWSGGHPTLTPRPLHCRPTGGPRACLQEDLGGLKGEALHHGHVRRQPLNERASAADVEPCDVLAQHRLERHPTASRALAQGSAKTRTRHRAPHMRACHTLRHNHTRLHTRIQPRVVFCECRIAIACDPPVRRVRLPPRVRRPPPQSTRSRARGASNNR